MKEAILIGIMSGVVLICAMFVLMTWVAGNLRVEGKQCDYVQINFAWQIHATGCK